MIINVNNYDVGIETLPTPTITLLLWPRKWDCKAEIERCGSPRAAY